MPVGPDLEFETPDDEYHSLPDIHYSAPTKFMANFHLGWLDNSAKSAMDIQTGDPSIPSFSNFYPSANPENFMPQEEALASAEEIADAQKNRENLKIPSGITKVGLQNLVNDHDDREKFEYISNRSPGLWPTIGGWLGTAVGFVTDPLAYIGGEAVAAKAEAHLITPFANKLMQSTAYDSIAGKGAPHLAGLLAASAAKNAALGAGYEGIQQIGVQAKNQSFYNETDWLDALQNIGASAGSMSLLGAGGKALEATLFGYKIPIVGTKPEFERHAPTKEAAEEIIKNHQAETNNKYGDRYKITEDPISKGFTVETEDRTGPVKLGEDQNYEGLLSSQSLRNLPGNIKDKIKSTFLWSKSADTAAREDAVTQALNGQNPDVGIILKHGAIEEGIRFKNKLKDDGVDLKDFDNRLVDADQETSRLLNNLEKIRKEIKKTDKNLIPEKDVTLPNSQQALADSKNLNETTPKNVTNYINIINKIEKTDPSNTAQIKKLKSKLPDLLTPRQELTTIQRQLLKNGLEENFEDTSAYKRLGELAKTWEPANNLLKRVHLEKQHQMQLKDYLGRKVMIDTMRKHVNDGHEPVTEDDIRKYGNYLNSSGFERVPENLGDKIKSSVDDALAEYTPERIKEILQTLNDPAIYEMIDDVVRDREAQETFKQFTKDLVECVMREST